MPHAVTYAFDEAQGCYYVVASDIPGLRIEADTFDEFREAAFNLAPQLLGSPARSITFQRGKPTQTQRHRPVL